MSGASGRRSGGPTGLVVVPVDVHGLALVRRLLGVLAVERHVVNFVSQSGLEDGRDERLPTITNVLGEIFVLLERGFATRGAVKAERHWSRTSFTLSFAAFMKSIDLTFLGSNGR